MGLDAGCGNGKYLGLRSVLQPRSTLSAISPVASTSKAKGKGKATEANLPQDTTLPSASNSLDASVITIGLDRSSNLVKIAKERSHEVLVGDAIDMPWREGTFDFAISIATIHHFTTPSRRRQAVRTMLRALNKKHGKLLIQVWAVEQEPPVDHTASADATESERKPYLKRQRDMDKLESAANMLSSLELSETKKQDVFVPWKLQPAQQKKSTIEAPSDSIQATQDSTPPVFQRYYHLFKAGELRALVLEAAREGFDGTSHHQLTIDSEERWESGNWSITASFAD